VQGRSYAGHGGGAGIKPGRAITIIDDGMVRQRSSIRQQLLRRQQHGNWM